MKDRPRGLFTKCFKPSKNSSEERGSTSRYSGSKKNTGGRKQKKESKRSRICAGEHTSPREPSKMGSKKRRKGKAREKRCPRHEFSMGRGFVTTQKTIV